MLVAVVSSIALVGAWRVWLHRHYREYSGEPWVFTPTPPKHDIDRALGLTAPELSAYGHVWADLLSEGADWIVRRKETVAIIDRTSLRRKISVDFVVPEALRDVSRFGTVHDAGEDGDKLVLVPILCLEKAPAIFTRFDFADEDRSSLPLPARTENATVSAHILLGLARRIVSEPLSPTLERDIVNLAMCDPGDANRYLDHLLDPTPELAAKSDEHRGLLAEDSSFEWLATTLASSSVVVAWVPQTPAPTRHIVKLSFDQQVDRRELQPWLAWGLRPWEIWMDSPFIGASSYHFEAEVTPSIEIMNARLIANLGDRYVTSEAIAASPRVHVYVPDAQRGQNSLALVRFRVQRDTFLNGALLASILTAGALSICVAAADHIARESANIAAILIALPSLIVGYVLRGTGHDFATQLIWKVRGLLLVVGVLPMLAGGRLAAERITVDEPADPAALTLVWVPLTVIAWICTAILVATYLLPRIPKRDRLS